MKVPLVKRLGLRPGMSDILVLAPRWSTDYIKLLCSLFANSISST